jgi:hypothetical protein
MQARGGPVRGSVGAPSVTYVLEQTLVVGDNNRDRVSTLGVRARSRQCYEGRPARMLAGTPVAGADRGCDPDVEMGDPDRGRR